MRLNYLPLFSWVTITALSAAELPPIPDTPQHAVVDEYHGVKVTDDYRWLEKPSGDPEIKGWVDQQNARTRAYLDALPNKKSVSARVAELIRSNSISYRLTVKRGDLFFALKLDPRLQQPTLVTLGSLEDPASEKVLLDPNQLDAKGSIAIDWFVVSLDGKKVGVSLSKGGSEAGDLHLYDVASAKEIGEVIPHVQNGTGGGSIAFTPDATGFWYTRYPRGAERPPEDSGFYQQIWFHQIGRSTNDDVYELGKDLPKIAEIRLRAKEDGKWILAQVKNGDGGEVEYFIRPTTPQGAWSQITAFSDKVYVAEFGQDETLFLVSRQGAQRGKVLRLPLDSTPTLNEAAEFIPESDGAVQDVVATGSRIYLEDLLGGPSRIRVYDRLGQRLPDLPILPVSSVDGMVRTETDDIIFSNGGYLSPPAWYRFSAEEGKVHKTSLAMTSLANFSDAEVVRDFATSKDGTKIPINIIKQKSAKLDGQGPAILSAYGGYGISQTPSFSAWRRVWLEHGGIWVVANLRGGGEFGDQWHLDGNLLKKQNVFDDFYACAQWLVEHKYTSPQKLAILGGSNGGLLMGAAIAQHPEMYRAVASMVGIYDMLRVELTTNGAFNVTEFGTVKDRAQFEVLYGYSPYHRLKKGMNYPAILLTTGVNDPRVDPWHSRKFAARLQAATASDRPVLLRTSYSAGHGIGSSLDETIAERSDILSFLLHETETP